MKNFFSISFAKINHEQDLSCDTLNISLKIFFSFMYFLVNISTILDTKSKLVGHPT